MNIKTEVCTIIGVMGGYITAIFGGWNRGVTALLVFMAIDFIFGLACACFWGKSDKSENGSLSSKACWRGLIKKCCTLLIVVCANFADNLLDQDYICNAVIIAFCASEFISICEIAGLMGVLPEGVQKILNKVIDLLKK